ncbi:apolipoprotein A-II [Polymixia lowei]
MTFACSPPYIILSSCEHRVTDNSLSEKTVTSWICTSNTTAEMNGKFALALILTLQVSMSLGEVADPDPELVAKYEAMKTVFYKRLLNAYARLQAAAEPIVAKLGEDGQGQAARDYMEGLQSKPQLQTAVKLATGLAQEAAPLVEKARMTGLGLYGTYLRPYIGAYLDDGINHAKVYLDKFMPAE